MESPLQESRLGLQQIFIDCVAPIHEEEVSNIFHHGTHPLCHELEGLYIIVETMQAQDLQLFDPCILHYYF